MRLGAVTYNVLKDWDLDTLINKLPELGFEAVELRTTHAHGVEPSLDADARREVREKFAAGKLKLLSYGTVCEFHSPEAAERARQLDIAKQFIDLARDTGAVGIKVRPNGLPEGVPAQTTISNIAGSLREAGYYAANRGIQVWLEVHGRDAQQPSVIADIMRATAHDAVGVCWNSNPTDVIDGSVKANFDLLRPWIRTVHINELANDYPWRELFTLLRKSGYEGYTLCEAQESKEPERFLRYYRALWRELNRG